MCDEGELPVGEFAPVTVTGPTGIVVMTRGADVSIGVEAVAPGAALLTGAVMVVTFVVGDETDEVVGVEGDVPIAVVVAEVSAPVGVVLPELAVPPELVVVTELITGLSVFSFELEDDVVPVSAAGGWLETG